MSFLSDTLRLDNYQVTNLDYLGRDIENKLIDGKSFSFETWNFQGKKGQYIMNVPVWIAGITYESGQYTVSDGVTRNYYYRKVTWYQIITDCTIDNKTVFGLLDSSPVLPNADREQFGYGSSGQDVQFIMRVNRIRVNLTEDCSIKMRYRYHGKAIPALTPYMQARNGEFFRLEKINEFNDKDKYADLYYY